MKHFFLAPVTLTFLLALSLCSCSDKTTNSGVDTVENNQEHSLSEEFAFPANPVDSSITNQGNSTESGVTDQSNANTINPDLNSATFPEQEYDTKTDFELATELLNYISEFVDLNAYKDPTIYDKNEYSAYYILDSDFELERNFDYDFLLGSENVPFTLFETYESLLDKGFTTVNSDINKDTVLNGVLTESIDLCTPDTNEIFGFQIVDRTGSRTKAGDFPVEAITLTNVNNFKAFGCLYKNSTIEDLLKNLGYPDKINVSATPDEFLATFEYLHNGAYVFVLADGFTKGIIALSVCGDYPID